MIDDQRPNDTGPDFVLTTKQVAEDLGISPDLVRRLKSDNADRLVEGTHWVKTDQNICLWSAAGLAELRAIREPSQPCETLSQPCETETSQPLQPADSTDDLTLDSLATDFENALRPHARKVARHEAAQHFRRLVEEEKRLEYQRLIEAANSGNDEALYGFTDPLFVVGAITSRNGHHKVLTGVSDGN